LIGKECIYDYYLFFLLSEDACFLSIISALFAQAYSQNILKNFLMIAGFHLDFFSYPWDIPPP
jgi:hypothetical protein